MPIIKKKKCIGCGICTDICPVNAISIRNGKALIDKTMCIHCGRCLDICPTNAIEQNHKKNNQDKVK